jgi:hypothetical protein
VTTRRPRGPRIWAFFVAGLAALVLWPEPLRATIEEQRARLPPPATCPDAVEGVWLGHYYDASDRTWYKRSLEIRRVAPGSDRVHGEIVAHFWDGGPKDVNPPPCRPGGQEHVVHMPAVGTATADGKVDFGGTSWRADPPICSRGGFGYAPDRFTGQIDPAIQEFQSVNNDGGRAVNEPNVFRRIRCFDADTPQRPTVDVKPPPFEPKRGLFSCGKR